ncbi:MAG: hypothetical protein ACOYNZ_02925 [Rhodoferax sp.]
MAKHPSIQNPDRTRGLITLGVLIYALAAAWYSWVAEKDHQLSGLSRPMPIGDLEAFVQRG